MEEAPKRPRIDMGGSGFIWNKNKKNQNKLTKVEVEQLVCRAFSLEKFPGWITPEGGNGQVMINGENASTGERIILSFWPSTGKVLFQGKPEDVERNKRRWEGVLGNQH